MRSWRTVDLVGLLALAILLALPAVAPSWLVGDLAMYLSYALLAVALAFAWGHCGLLSLGHGVFFGIGAYAMGTLTLGMLPGLEAVRSTWLGLVFAVAASGATAWTIGWFTFAGRGLHGAFFGIVTLALAVVFERLAINWDWLGGLNGLMNVPPITLGLNGDGAELWEPVPLFYVMLGVLAATVAGLTAYQRSDGGLALAALRENELRARALGYDAGALTRRAFALSGAVAGLAGARVAAARAAIDRTGSGVLLTARSEGFIAGRPDLDETVRRLKAFAEAGADCLYAPGIGDDAQITAVVQAVAPKPVNVLTLGRPVAELAALGARRISVGGSLARTAYGEFLRAARGIAEDGSFAAFKNAAPSRELNGFFSDRKERRG
jgi:ABC-type branched-subunit amino acid transport system permease subunit